MAKIVRTETIAGKSWDDEDIVDINNDLSPEFAIGERVVVIPEAEYDKLKSFYDRYREYCAPMERELFGNESGGVNCGS